MQTSICIANLQEKLGSSKVIIMTVSSRVQTAAALMLKAFGGNAFAMY